MEPTPAHAPTEPAVTPAIEQVDQALALGAFAQAVELAAQAEREAPANPDVRHRFGLALTRAGRFHEAVQKLTQGLQLAPQSIPLRLALARAALGMNDGWAATAWLSDACRAAPDNAALWTELARVLKAQGRDSELPAALQAGLALHPDDAAMRAALAGHLLHRGEYAAALPHYECLYALDPHDTTTLLHYGYSLEQTGDLAGAVARYREAIALRPDFLEAHVDLAGVLWRVDEHEAALAHARRAVEIGPDHPYAVRILGTALLHLNRLAEAETALRRALAIEPGFSLAQVDLALLLLLSGRYAEGWDAYHQRWRDARMKRPAFFRPELEWQGPRLQPLAGRRIVVYAEQGLGDVIHFARYAKRLQEDGATVMFVVQPPLVTLIESMPGVVCLKPDTDLHADWHVALLDLPWHYGTVAETVPAEVPYLHAPPAKARQWRERLKPWDGKLKVGVAWAGHHVQVNHLNRSMALSEFAPLMQLPGVQCFSLQKSDGGVFTDCAPGADALVDFTADWEDFSDSAAMMDNLDLVISVDTAVPHLAGALARPVWVMLPPNADWRWLAEGDTSAWYPTMRLFRRGFGEARGAQVARVLKELRAQKNALLAHRQTRLV